MNINKLDKIVIKKVETATKPLIEAAEIIAEQEAPKVTKCDSEVLKAYCGIPLKKIEENITKKDEVLAFFEDIPEIKKVSEKIKIVLEGTNETLKKQARNKQIQLGRQREMLITALSNKDGSIEGASFDCFKAMTEKYDIKTIIDIFKTSKENGTINTKALTTISEIFPKTDIKEFYRDNYLLNLLNQMKNKDGKFNDKVLDLFLQDTNAFKDYMQISPKSIFDAIKNPNGEFSDTAIDYFSKRLKEKQKIQTILKELYKAKDANGQVDIENIQIINDLEKEFEGNILFWLKTIVSQTPKENKKTVIDALKPHANNEYFRTLIDVNSTLNLPYTEKNIDFLKKLIEISKNNKQAITQIIEKTKLTPEALNDDNSKILSKMFYSIYDPKDLEPMINLGIIQSGQNKGQYSFDNLNKYIDIYNSNRHDISSVQSIASRLSLEEDDEVLKTFHRLYTLKFPTKNGKDYDTVDRKTLDVMLDLLTQSVDNKPGRIVPKELPLIKNLNKIMNDDFVTQSKGVFENFLFSPDLANIEKLKRIQLTDAGLPPEQATSPLFANTDEKDLIKFKDFLLNYKKQNGYDKLQVRNNDNISGRIEILAGDLNTTNILIYDYKNLKPLTKLKEENQGNRLIKTQHDFARNLETKTEYVKDYSSNINYKLKHQTITHFDSNGKELYQEDFSQSPINGVLNIKNIYPNGEIKIISNAYIDKNTGNKIIEKNLTSFNQTQTTYRYEADASGNYIIDYKITDKNGKELLNQSTSYERLSQYHYRTSKNNKIYDVKYLKDSCQLEITEEQTGIIKKIDLKEFSKDTEENIIPILTQIPGDELFKMNELGLKNLKIVNYYDNANYSLATESITLGKNYTDLGIIMHEWGHAKDNLMFKDINELINNDKELFKIFKKERDLFRKNFSESQLNQVSYLISDKHYCGTDKAIIEGIADTNTLLNTYPQNNTQAIRTHYWQQYFPETISYLAKLII